MQGQLCKKRVGLRGAKVANKSNLTSIAVDVAVAYDTPEE